MSTNIQLGTFYVFDGHIHPIENVMLLQLTQKLIMDNIKVQILFTIDLQKKNAAVICITLSFLPYKENS